MGEFMLTVLDGVATLERHLIKARTDTGIKRARAAGIKFGRPSALNKQQEEALKLLADGKLQSGELDFAAENDEPALALIRIRVMLAVPPSSDRANRSGPEKYSGK